MGKRVIYCYWTLDDIVQHAQETLEMDLTAEEVEEIIRERSGPIVEYLSEIGWELISEALETY